MNNPNPNPKQSLKDWISNFLNGWQEITRLFEMTLVDNIAATIPWLAPVIPAYMVYSSLRSVLGFPSWVAVVGGIVTEFLGLATVNTTFQLWDYNDKRIQDAEARRLSLELHRKPSKRTTQAKRKVGRVRGLAPVVVAGGTAFFYLSVIITVNVVLDKAPLDQVIAKALLSLLGVVASVTLAVRAQHARRVAEKQERKELARQRNEARKAATPAETLPARSEEPSRNVPPVKADWRNLSVEEKDAILTMTDREVMDKYGVTDRCVRGWRLKAKSNGFHTETVANPN